MAYEEIPAVTELQVQEAQTRMLQAHNEHLRFENNELKRMLQDQQIVQAMICQAVRAANPNAKSINLAWSKP